jgi:transposase-like protein
MRWHVIEKEFKEQTVKKMMPPNAASVARLSRDTGVSEAMLYNWRNEYRRQGFAVPADPSNPELRNLHFLENPAVHHYV